MPKLMKNMCTSRSWYLMLSYNILLYIFQDTTKGSADFSTFTLLMQICHFTLLQVKHETNDESITNLFNDTFTVIKFTT